jgi:hypothetical protein
MSCALPSSLLYLLSLSPSHPITIPPPSRLSCLTSSYRSVFAFHTIPSPKSSVFGSRPGGGEELVSRADVVEWGLGRRHVRRLAQSPRGRRASGILRFVIVGSDRWRMHGGMFGMDDRAEGDC